MTPPRSSYRLLLAAFLCWTLLPPALRADPEGDLADRIASRLDRARGELIAIRRDLHRNPEISGREERTSARVAERLRALGLEVSTGVGGHGVIGLLRGGKPGPVVAFRADMDATRSQAADPVDFPSLVPGVHHVCGHDIHTTVGLALAEGLAAVREDFAGTVKLLFQPSEETARGARAMIADGALDDPRPAAIFAFHTTPYPVGTIATHPGTALAGRDRIALTLRGEGDMAAAEATARALLSELTTVAPEQIESVIEGDFLISRIARAQPLSDGSGLQLLAIATTTSDAFRDRAERDLRAGLETQLPDGVGYELEIQRRWVAGVSNDRELEARVRGALRAAVGEERLVESSGIPPQFSEDFGSFQAEVPGVMYWLGVSNAEKGFVGMPHSPTYAADEEAIFVGARAMAAVLLEFLTGG